MEGWIWGLVIIGGPILIGLAMFIFGDMRRRPTPGERAAGDRAAHENWGKEEIR